jgi:hypothetical protein
MKALTAFVFGFVNIVCVIDCIPFVARNNPLHSVKPRFAHRKLHRGGGKSNNVVFDTTDDYERALKAILMSVEKIEAIVEKAVAHEVDILFHKDHTEKEKVTLTTKKAIADGVDKVKTTIIGHSGKSLYPFETKSQQPQSKHVDHRDHRVLNAIEAAERAVLRAIANEVDILFHETVHNDKGNNKNNPIVAQTKAYTVVDKVHDHRRDWLLNVSASMIEDYSMPAFFLE